MTGEEGIRISCPRMGGKEYFLRGPTTNKNRTDFRDIKTGKVVSFLTSEFYAKPSGDVVYEGDSVIEMGGRD